MMIALDNSHNGVAKFLLERGANPHVWDVYGRTALYIAVGNTSGGAASGRTRWCCRWRPGCGRTRAQLRQLRVAEAAGTGRRAALRGGGRGGGARTAQRQVSTIEIINMLLAAGVDTNPQLNMRRPSNQGGRFSDPLLSSGTTPLLRALINNDTEVARLLLEKGANPNIYGMGLSPWLYAAGITSGRTTPRGAAVLAVSAWQRRRQYGASRSDDPAWRRRECPGKRRGQLFRSHRPRIDRRPREHEVQRRDDGASRRRSIPKHETWFAICSIKGRDRTSRMLREGLRSMC